MKRENIEIKIDGISVNSEKNTIYFLFATEPLTLILAFIEFDISLKIKMKKTNKKTIFAYKSIFKFWSLRSTKLLSKKVKNVMKPNNNVVKKIIKMNVFLFMNSNISLKYIKFA